MLTYSEMEQLNRDIESISLKLTEVKHQYEELEFEAGCDGFWDDIDRANKCIKQLGEVRRELYCLQEICDDWEYAEMIHEEMQSSSYIDDNNDYELLINKIWTDVDVWKKTQLLNGKYDKLNAVVTLHAGSGGTESCDFTDMIMRAIIRWSENCGFKVDISLIEDGDVAGVKTASMFISGKNAYGYAKALNGVFRLVRISPFDAAARRHTSFMAVEVAPELEDDSVIEVKIEDCDIATFRSGGKGGQYQNKTDSGVRLTHKPTGFIAECREERSQLQNKNRCLEKLRAMIFQKQQQEQEKELNDIKGEKTENGWGNAICSIVLMPYQLVKDTRTGWESGNTSGFLDGELGDFIDAYLEYNRNC